MDNLNIVRELLASGAEINIQDKKGRTALYIAAMNGNVKIAKELLAKGAEIDKGPNGDTAIKIAKKLDHKKVVELLESYK